MILLLIIKLYLTSTLELKYLKNRQALCLDGSLSTYYYQKGYEEGKNKFIIHFERADLILGLTEDQYFENAIQRQETLFGSSLNRALTQEFDGLLSRDKNKNKYFYNWNVIYINSCEGTGFQGYREKPYEYNGKEIYFRGDLIVRSIFKEFQSSFEHSDIILLTGCSTGAIASLLWSNYISLIIPTTTYLLCVPDSGIFLEMMSIEGTELLQQSLKIMNYVVNTQINIPNQQCGQNYPNQSWKCFYLQNLLQYVSTPIFIIQSLYDIDFLNDYLKVSCITSLTLDGCSKLEKQYIEAAHLKFHTTVTNQINQNPTSGSFAPSCISNCFFVSSTSFSNLWSIPESSNKTINSTLVKWIQFQMSEQTVLEDLALIDHVYWPNNQPCALLNKNTQILQLLNIFFMYYYFLNF